MSRIPVIPHNVLACLPPLELSGVTRTLIIHLNHIYMRLDRILVPLALLLDKL